MKTIIALLAALTITGCATTDTLQPGKSDSAKFTVENKTYDQVWKASVKAVSSQLTIVQKSKENGIIKAEKGVGMATWGEVVGVFISPAGTAATKFMVEVQSYKRSRLQITGQDWTQTIVTAIETELDQ
jgi:hypothetical protein